MCGFDSDSFPECKSKSLSGCFIHQAGIFGVKCFSKFCGLIPANLVHYDETKKRAHDSQIVRAKENS